MNVLCLLGLPLFITCCWWNWQFNISRPNTKFLFQRHYELRAANMFSLRECYRCLRYASLSSKLKNFFYDWLNLFAYCFIFFSVLNWEVGLIWLCTAEVATRQIPQHFEPMIVIMLSHRLRRYLNVEPSLTTCAVFAHLAVSGLTVRLPVWPWQQVCVKRVRKWGVRATWIFIMTSLVYWLQRGGHTQVRLFGPPESTVNWPGRRREEVGSEHITHIRVIQVLPVADNWIDEDVFAGHTFIFLRKGGGSPANSVQTSVKERGFPLGGATPLPPIDPRLFQLGDIIAPLRSAIDTKWHFQHQKIV